MPTISIVIPAYNAAAFIGQAIGSILKSDYPHDQLEISVVDDGSTDATVDQARAVLAGARIPWTIHQCDRGGPSRARNLGWRLSRGEWIQFLDADDTLAPSKLFHQAEAARNLSKVVAVVYSTWAPVEQRPGQPPVIRAARLPVIGPDPLIDLLKTENFIATGSQLFRRTWLEQVGGFDESYRLLEDVDLAVRIAMAGGVFVSTAASQPLFFYHQRGGSWSRSNRAGFIHACVRNARLAETFWERTQGALRSEQRSLLLVIYGNALRAFYETERREFWALLRHVHQLDPGYYPAQPAPLSWLSRGVGYPTAERVALCYRRVTRRVLHVTPGG